MNNVLVDTGFWFALYDEKDQYHNKALKVMDRLINSRFLIPFPTLYETLNTSFVKKKEFTCISSAYFAGYMCFST